MIITCVCGEKKFNIPDGSIPVTGRMVQCGYCDKEWKQFPVVAKEPKVVKLKDPVAIKKLKLKGYKKLNHQNRMKKEKNQVLVFLIMSLHTQLVSLFW